MLMRTRKSLACTMIGAFLMSTLLTGCGTTPASDPVKEAKPAAELTGQALMSRSLINTLPTPMRLKPSKTTY